METTAMDSEAEVSIMEQGQPKLAAAIWWWLDESGGVLKARDGDATATFHLVTGHEIGVKLATLCDGRSKYDIENANPRRQHANTLTRASAQKRAEAMYAAARARVNEASKLAESDPCLTELHIEIRSARGAYVVARVRSTVAKLSVADAFDRNGYLQDALCVKEHPFPDASNPWSSNKRALHMHARDYDERQERVAERILCVLGIEGTP